MREPSGSIVEVRSNGVLKLLTGSGWHIDIESPLHYVDANGGRTIDARHPGIAETARELLVGKEIVSVRIDESGRLKVALDAKCTLTVWPDPDYEAWIIVGPDQEMLVCMPGGELAEWDAVADEDLSS